MIRRGPNLVMVERIATALGPLRERLVFVGGCAAGLLLTDPAAALARVTYDVDLLAEVTALPGYHQLEETYSGLGFKRDMTPEAPICRWRFDGIKADLMPTDDTVLGFANRWYPLVAKTCRELVLPSGTAIRLIAAPAFVATKFEAFSDRGQGDFLLSHDLEDIINVVDGRPELADEMAQAPEELRGYVGARFREMLEQPRFHDALPGLIFPDESHSERLSLVRQRLKSIAEYR
ncbi:MAG TPA: hypothetical protein PKE50_13680 [Rhodocyclaceae bacterium]|nr:hypothetical protein [Rhodocyclaceae bacterium]HNA86289.1 hypothetical protein [Nitrospira sp.]HNG03830.1 hypothetical protein [Nitrospira sp.]